MADQSTITQLANAIIGLCDAAPGLLALYPPDDPLVLPTLLDTYFRIRNCAVAESQTPCTHLCGPTASGVLQVLLLNPGVRLTGLQACYDALVVVPPSLNTLTAATTGIDHLASGQGDHSQAIRQHAGRKGWPNHRPPLDPEADGAPASAAQLLEGCVFLCSARLQSSELPSALRSKYEGILLHATLDLLNVPHGGLRKLVDAKGGPVAPPKGLPKEKGPRRKEPDSRDLAWGQVQSCHGILSKLTHSASDLAAALAAIQHLDDGR